MQPNNPHNDKRNITLDDLKEAGKYSGLDLKTTIVTMIKTITCSLAMLNKGKKDFASEEKCI